MGTKVKDLKPPPKLSQTLENGFFNSKLIRFMAKDKTEIQWLLVSRGTICRWFRSRADISHGLNGLLGHRDWQLMFP